MFARPPLAHSDIQGHKDWNLSPKNIKNLILAFLYEYERYSFKLLFFKTFLGFDIIFCILEHI